MTRSLTAYSFLATFAAFTLAAGRSSSLAAAAGAQDPGVIRFSGVAVRGASFSKGLWGGLAFVLKATPEGWDIVVTTSPTMGTDFSWIMTPPFRSDNPRHIGTGYGHTVQEAAKWTPRAFGFVTNEPDYVKANEAVRKLSWPAGIPGSELDGYARSLAMIPRAGGSLRIVNAASQSGGKGSTAIDSLSFEVEIRRPIDIEAALRAKFLRERSEYETVDEACPGAKTLEVGKIVHHDLNGDGFDEVVVVAHSCLAGTGGADLLAVFSRKSSGEVVELSVERPSDPRELEGLRGKADIDVRRGRLVMEYPIYRDGDSNCCPTGGMREFRYRWDGKMFRAEN